MKKRDFDKINFKKVEIRKNKKIQKNSSLEEYDLQMKKFQEKEKKKVELQKRLQKEKENFLNFFNKKIAPPILCPGLWVQYIIRIFYS